MDSSKGPAADKAQHYMALNEEAPALPSTPTVGSAHLWAAVGVRPQKGQAGTCCKGQQVGGMGSASPAEPGPGRHRTAPPGSSLLPKNRLESLTWKTPWELSALQALLCWGVSEGVTRAGRGSLPGWHHLSRILLFLCGPGHHPLFSAEERTRKTQRKPGSVQRKNWGWDTASSDRPAQGRRKQCWGWREGLRGPGRG